MRKLFALVILFIPIGFGIYSMCIEYGVLMTIKVISLSFIVAGMITFSIVELTKPKK